MESSSKKDFKESVLAWTTDMDSMNLFADDDQLKNRAVPTTSSAASWLQAFSRVDNSQNKGVHKCRSKRGGRNDKTEQSFPRGRYADNSVSKSEVEKTVLQSSSIHRSESVPTKQACPGGAQVGLIPKEKDDTLKSLGDKPLEYDSSPTKQTRRGRRAGRGRNPHKEVSPSKNIDMEPLGDKPLEGGSRLGDREVSPLDVFIAERGPAKGKKADLGYSIHSRETGEEDIWESTLKEQDLNKPHPVLSTKSSKKASLDEPIPQKKLENFNAAIQKHKITAKHPAPKDFNLSSPFAAVTTAGAVPTAERKTAIAAPIVKSRASEVTSNTKGKTTATARLAALTTKHMNEPFTGPKITAKPVPPFPDKLKDFFTKVNYYTLDQMSNKPEPEDLIDLQDEDLTKALSKYGSAPIVNTSAEPEHNAEKNTENSKAGLGAGAKTFTSASFTEARMQNPSAIASDSESEPAAEPNKTKAAQFWPLVQKLDGERPRTRKVYITFLPELAGEKFVTSIVWGGPLESISIGIGTATVIFVDGEHCQTFHAATSDGIVYGKNDDGSSKRVYVELGKDVDAISSKMSMLTSKGATRVLQASGMNFEVSLKELLLKAGKFRQIGITAARDERADEHTRRITLRFAKLEDAVEFKGYLSRDSDWEAFKVQFGKDPCDRFPTIAPEY